MRATDATTGEALLIVGAGVAGLSLAIALGRAGIRVTVIDGASRPQTPLMAGTSTTGICG